MRPVENSLVPTSMTALSRVRPCDLWMVTAHANFRLHHLVLQHEACAEGEVLSSCKKNRRKKNRRVCVCVCLCVCVCACVCVLVCV